MGSQTNSLDKYQKSCLQKFLEKCMVESLNKLLKILFQYQEIIYKKEDLQKLFQGKLLETFLKGILKKRGRISEGILWKYLQKSLQKMQMQVVGKFLNESLDIITKDPRRIFGGGLLGKNSSTISERISTQKSTKYYLNKFCI